MYLWFEFSLLKKFGWEGFFHVLCLEFFNNLNIFKLFFDPRYAWAEKYVKNVSNIEKFLDKALEKWTCLPKFLFCTLNSNHEYINIYYNAGTFLFLPLRGQHHSHPATLSKAQTHQPTHTHTLTQLKTATIELLLLHFSPSKPFCWLQKVPIIDPNSNPCVQCTWIAPTKMMLLFSMSRWHFVSGPYGWCVHSWDIAQLGEWRTNPTQRLKPQRFMARMANLPTNGLLR